MHNDDQRAIEPVERTNISIRSTSLRNPRVIRGLARLDRLRDSVQTFDPTFLKSESYVAVEFPSDEFERGYLWYLDDSNNWVPIGPAQGMVEIPWGVPLRFESLEFGFSDADFETLVQLQALNVLRLQEAEEVTDAGFGSLSELPLLQSLTLHGTRVSDAGLVVLRDLPNLRTLSCILNECVTDRGLEHVGSLPHLTSLELVGVGFTDAGLHHLQQLHHLETLELEEAQIDDASLRYLRSMSRLRFLDLSFTEIGDSGLRFLESLTNLRFLDLSNTRVGDASIQSLAQLEELSVLCIENTQITDRGRMAIQRALPQVELATRSIKYEHRARIWSAPSEPKYPGPSLEKTIEWMMDNIESSDGTILREWDERLRGK